MTWRQLSAVPTEGVEDSMRQAVDNFIDRSTPASRCLIGAMVSLPAIFAYLIAHGLALSSPEVSIALRPGVVWLLQGILLLSFGVVVWAGAWAWPRRHSREEQPLASLAVALGVGVPYTALTIAVGSFTAGPNLVLLGVFANGLLLFDRRTMLIAFGVCASILMGYDALELAGQVPYAPAITALVFHGDTPQWWWYVWRNVVFYLGLGSVVAVMVVLFGRLDAVHSQLSRLSYTDVLTGLANRRYFMDRLQAELVRQRRTQRPLTLVMMDVDHFKLVNDTHGHPAGDEVLATLAMLMRECVRNPTDLTVRLGGEEFAMVLPDATLREAHVVCARLHERLARHEFMAEGQCFKVTVSMGLAQCHGQDVEALIQQADRQLYSAKQGGRNRSMSSDGVEMAA